MVTLNLTIFIELVLFLIFLWGAAVFIFRPTLRQLDEREEQIEKNERRTVVDEDISKSHERRYLDETSKMRKQSDESFRVERQKALKKRAAILADKGTQAERAIQIVREEAAKEIGVQREQFAKLIPVISDSIRRQLAEETPKP